MKIIPPYQITSEILTLIHEAKEYLILVSPYVNFNNWESIKVAIQNAANRNVKFKFYCRLDSENFKSWEQIEALGIQPKLVKNLHSKLYFNEKAGIVTSMNLLTSSNLNAMEFGAIYNTTEELEELKSYVKKYLEPNVEKEKPNDEDLYIAKEKFQFLTQNYLSKSLEFGVSCKWQNGSLIINAKNTYYINLDKVRNIFSISGVVSGLESENFNKFKIDTNLSNLEFIQNGEVGMMSSFVAVSKKSFSHNNFDFLSVNEKKEILDHTLEFIIELTEFKSYVYENRKIVSIND
ncbi:MULTISPECIES: phospholipase D-like domain-containing protein [unclassified Flavobacterium]|uniref:phospholipase D-like domain-containing protein n=1 Tax=unclassified Flavobacterium TaxID=196869 RepID=UPI003F90D999